MLKGVDTRAGESLVSCVTLPEVLGSVWGLGCLRVHAAPPGVWLVHSCDLSTQLRAGPQHPAQSRPSLSVHQMHDECIPGAWVLVTGQDQTQPPSTLPDSFLLSQRGRALLLKATRSAGGGGDRVLEGEQTAGRGPV